LLCPAAGGSGVKSLAMWRTIASIMGNPKAVVDDQDGPVARRWRCVVRS
jgi:hypothetical protein